MKIERLSAKDFEEAMDFINLVFSMAHCPFDFARFLPRLYQPTDECMSRNLVVRENGKIRGFVGMYPDLVKAGDVTLKLGGIGAVSSHPNDRGKGWMKLLVEKQVEEMRNENIDLSFLIGQRQRYMYFGYEKAGQMLEFKVNNSNLKHFTGQGEAIHIRFERLQAGDLAGIRKAKELHDLQPVHCIRTEEAFYSYLLTGFMSPWAALDQNNRVLGYLVAGHDHKRISELFVENASTLASLLRAWFLQQNIQEAVLVQPIWAKDTSQSLGNFAEEIQLTGSGNWQIFCWEKVISTLLRVKAKQEQLLEGTLCIGIKDYGNLKICVDENAIKCERTLDPADISLQPLLATRVLLGNIPAACAVPVPRRIESILSSWFPLPLSWIPQNYV